MSEKHIGKVIQVIGPVLDIVITASVSFSFGNYRSKTDCWLWPTNFPFRYSVGEIPTYCLKYFPKNDCVGKLSLVAISLILKSVLSSRYLASVMTFCMIHCKALLPDFSLMTEEKYRADKHCLSA